VADAPRAALVVVTRDDEARATVTRELERRYGLDYRIVSCADPADAAERLVAADLPAAALFGGMGGADPDGLTVLRGLHGHHPGAMAVAVVRWGDFETARPIFEALTLGQLDRWLYVPEVVGDEEFHRAVTEILEEWTARRGGGFEAVRMVGDRWSERAQHLRDTLTRNRIPLGFYEADSAEGRSILTGLHLDRPRMPVVQLRFRPGRPVLEDPSDLEPSGC
jgi:hypothetical protein